MHGQSTPGLALLRHTPPVVIYIRQSIGPVVVQAYHSSGSDMG